MCTEQLFYLTTIVIINLREFLIQKFKNFNHFSGF